ncbi:ABC-type sugar transport system, permease component [Rhodospirillales bacterium URHD0017]|nr:ABC-type sugar transport system, permease component [Rhodospirillales bacterium URHD0017]
MKDRLEALSSGLHRASYYFIVSFGGILILGLVGAVGDVGAHLALASSDQRLLRSISTTAGLCLASIALQLLLLLVVTLFVRTASLLTKAALALPFACGTIAPAAAFYVLVSPSMGPTDLSWFLSSVWGAWSLLVLIDTWQWVSLLFLFAIIRIERIPDALFHEAQLEGMSRLQQWRLIVWPAISRIVLLYVALRVLDWLRKGDYIKLLYGQGYTDDATKTFAMYALEEYTHYGDAGYAVFLALLQVLAFSILLVFVFRSVTAPKHLEVPASGQRRTHIRDKWQKVTIGLVFVVLLLPAVWLVLVALQSSDAAIAGRYQFLPDHLTLESFAELWRSQRINFRQSIGFFAMTAVGSTVLAFNTMYQLITRFDAVVERRFVVASIAIFVLPAFAAFTAVAIWSRFAHVSFDFLAFCTTSVLSGFALGFAGAYMLLKFGNRNRYEQLLLEFRNRRHAFAGAHLGQDDRSVLIVFVLVFAYVWNELFLNSRWTTTEPWRPFAVEVATTIGGYSTNYSVLAAGAVLSMMVPVVLAASLSTTLWMARRISTFVLSMRS